MVGSGKRASLRSDTRYGHSVHPQLDRFVRQCPPLKDTQAGTRVELSAEVKAEARDRGS
jgi:hypothetical protein